MNKEMKSIQSERESPSFDVRKMTYFLDGDEEFTKCKELASLIVERDPILNYENYFDLDAHQAKENTMRMLRRAHEVRKSLVDKKLQKAFDVIMEMHDRAFTMRLYVHKILFHDTIWAQGTEEQYQKWEEDIKEMRVLGCFAMTELGHSSFLRGIETTATYDAKTQEFIINTESITGTKWWIGMAGKEIFNVLYALGHAATHTVALCKLIIDGKNCGLYWFIVPLRNKEDGSLMPGVTAGSLGMKAGRQGLDNGWIQFTNVRVPRENMLMRWAQVTADGQFIPPKNLAISYMTLIGERLLTLEAVNIGVGQCVTIATRYACVRTQGEKNQKIMDFQSHQYRLLPIIACVYATHCVFRHVFNEWEKVQSLHQNKETQQQFLDLYQDFHALAAALKSTIGWWGADALETIRRSVGGHAYSAYNAIASHIADFAVVTTGGGDNIVLAQQNARYLMNCLKQVSMNKKVFGSASYLNNLQKILKNNKFKVHSSEDLYPENLLDALLWISTKIISKTGMKLNQDFKLSKEEAWNNNMMDLILSSDVHCWYFVLKTFYDTIQRSDTNLEILMKLFKLLALSIIEKKLDLFLELEYMNGKQSRMIREEILSLCKELRSQAVPLVDAFNYPDWILKAPIGRFDGDIYHHYLETIKKVPKSMGCEYWNKEVKPLLSRF